MVGRSIADGSGRRIPRGVDRIDHLEGRRQAHGHLPVTGGGGGWDRKVSIEDGGGHLRGYLTRAGGKEDEPAIDAEIDGWCTLSHSIAWKINKKKPDSMGGIVYDLDRKQSQCDCRPGRGGVLRSVSWIGTNGVAGTSGEAGTPNFKSVSRPLAGAGMLPQGRLAGEHVHSTSLSGMWSGRLVAICFCYRLRLCMTETMLAQVRYLDRFCVRIASKS